MDCWTAFHGDARTLPAYLLPEERLVKRASSVGLYEGKEKVVARQSGTLVLTNWRLLYLDDTNARLNLALDLAWIRSIDHYRGFARSSPKVHLHLAKATFQGHRRDSESSQWICSTCSYANTVGGDNAQCQLCGMAKGRSSAEVACPACTFLNRAESTKCELCDTSLKPQLVPSQPQQEPMLSYKLSFRAGEDGSMYEALKITLKKKEWTRQAPVRQNGSQGQLGARQGLDHLMRQASLTQNESLESIESSFQDLKALVAKADEMMTLAADLRARLDRRKAEQGRSSVGSDETRTNAGPSEDDLIERALLQTTASLGSTSSEIDRGMIDDLSTWLPRYLDAQGGLASMPDVWCRWNRLKGLELISPQDALAAVKALAQRPDRPALLKELKSGALVLCSASLSPTALGQRILAASSIERGMTTFEIKDELGIELQINILEECIHECEMDSSALLCRDENGVQGITWFPNRILSIRSGEKSIV